MHSLLTTTSGLRGKMGVEVLHTIVNITLPPCELLSRFLDWKREASCKVIIKSTYLEYFKLNLL